MALATVLNRRRQVPAEDSPAFGAIAERFRRAGELERAVALCREGLAKYPRHMSSRVTLGWALLDLGRYDEARIELEQVIKRAPDNLAAIRGLAQLHDRTEHDDVASMQTEPSQWASPESDGELNADELAGDPNPEAASESDEEQFNPEPGPWVGLQPESKPVFTTAAQEAVAHLSEVDAMAAELLESQPLAAPAPSMVRSAPAIELTADAEQPWCNDGLQLEALEDSSPMAPVLELVQPPQQPVDEGFIPDDGPGPWPPVFEDEPQPAHHLRLARVERDVWPPLDRKPPIKCAPAVVVPAAGASGGSESIPTEPRPGLLSALGKFRRRVDARRREVVSESAAG